MKAVATNIFGVRRELAAVTVEINQRHVISCRQCSDTSVPVLDLLEHLGLLGGSLIGKDG